MPGKNFMEFSLQGEKRYVKILKNQYEFNFLLNKGSRWLACVLCRSMNIFIVFQMQC
jgi:hypothetical protein